MIATREMSIPIESSPNNKQNNADKSFIDHKRDMRFRTNFRRRFKYRATIPINSIFYFFSKTF